MSDEKAKKIPAEKFVYAQLDQKLHDNKLETKAIGYFKDAWLRFKKNRGSVVAFCLIVFLMLFSLIVPFFSNYVVTFRDGYYKTTLPKNPLFSGAGFWDGTGVQKETLDGNDYFHAIGIETNRPVVIRELGNFTDANGIEYFNLRVDSYAKVGFAFINLDLPQYEALQAFQDETGIQILYPVPKTHSTSYVMGNGGANFWYQLADESFSTGGLALRDAQGHFIPNYLTSDNPGAAAYQSLRIPGDDGGADGAAWYVYAVKNQSGYKVRVDYYEYFQYVNGFEPVFLFGANIYGQDIFTCLAAGGRLSFLLAFSVSFINFLIGACYGAFEGYYGGTKDIVMERISDILYAVPFVVVATLFQMHLSATAGTLPSLLFAFVLTGWIPMAARVRMQFYRFKGQEYVLAARTLGAKDLRLIFKHIFPNALGTIVTGSVLAIPGVIFTESYLSFLKIINLETSSLTSIGTMLANGQGFLNTYPHIVLFPSLFISILMISFNLLGNGLRDAFNPSLRGADE